MSPFRPFRRPVLLGPPRLGPKLVLPAALGGDEMLVLGDNVPILRDSRRGERPGVPGDRILGRLLPIGT